MLKFHHQEKGFGKKKDRETGRERNSITTTKGERDVETQSRKKREKRGNFLACDELYLKIRSEPTGGLNSNRIKEKS